MKKEEINMKQLKIVLNTIEKLNFITKDLMTDKVIDYEYKEWKIRINVINKDCISIVIWWNDFEIKFITIFEDVKCITFYETWKDSFEENLKERLYLKFLQL